MLLDHSLGRAVQVDPGVYAPQHDSLLLIGTMRQIAPPEGRRVCDLYTGTGYLALEAARLGAASVVAFDICPHAVKCAKGNAVRTGFNIDVVQGDWTRAAGREPFDLVLANPPYVPGDRRVILSDNVPTSAGPALAFHAGVSGRLVLDPLCAHAREILAPGGVLLVVQSEFADIAQTVHTLNASGLKAEIAAEQYVPFGPVMSARAAWLERMGRLQKGRRVERLAVVAAKFS
ncbi:methyltransferase [Mycobacteroides saopaulense]|uniref:Methyltransferase n=1 Tax=Mycobacteroides saopaulense TaxID=1578165 RepID=A0A1X0J3B6_9MYCO|nr:HemK2/MTQ2 family protein methyltransferase [Mycobacteroides saopaulense]ORB56481.1 methyltransferase [Mycobacteroides saopaulense]